MYTLVIYGIAKSLTSDPHVAVINWCHLNLYNQAVDKGGLSSILLQGHGAIKTGEPFILC